MNEPLKIYDRNPPEEPQPPITARIVTPRVVATPQPVLLPQISGMAMTSTILGVLGLMTGGMCGCFPIPLLAVIFGHISLSKTIHYPHMLVGRGYALTGIITGYLGLVACIVLMLMFALMGAAMNGVLGDIIRMMSHTPPRM